MKWNETGTLSCTRGHFRTPRDSHRARSPANTLPMAKDLGARCFECRDSRRVRRPVDFEAVHAGMFEQLRHQLLNHVPAYMGLHCIGICIRFEQSTTLAIRAEEKLVSQGSRFLPRSLGH